MFEYDEDMVTVDELDEMRESVVHLASVVDEASSDAELVDRMVALTALRNCVNAALACTEYSFARAHAARVTAAGDVDPERLERSIGAQIGASRKEDRDTVAIIDGDGRGVAAAPAVTAPLAAPGPVVASPLAAAPIGAPQ